MSPKPAVYEPRNITIRRELFRFADDNHIYIRAEHHPVKPSPRHGLTTDSVWHWYFEVQWVNGERNTIPLTELRKLFGGLYFDRHIWFFNIGHDDSMVEVLVSTESMWFQS